MLTIEKSSRRRSMASRRHPCRYRVPVPRLSAFESVGDGGEDGQESKALDHIPYNLHIYLFLPASQAFFFFFFFFSFFLSSLRTY